MTMVDFEAFSREAVSITMLENLKMLTLDTYNIDTDPMDHLLYFNTKMIISDVTDAIEYRGSLQRLNHCDDVVHHSSGELNQQFH